MNRDRLIERLQADPHVIDDYKNRTIDVEYVGILRKTKNEEEFFCPLSTIGHTGLRAIVEGEDGKLYLDKTILGHISDSYGVDVVDAIERYNKDGTFGVITDIIKVN